MSADPFGTAALRDSVLAGWASSPTRFREDANAEEDLRLGGYADRLLVELAQNAADAAQAAGTPGTLRVSVVDGELRVANTGAPLDSAGVAALASLRASAKRDGTGVGRFGVGFAAVLAVTDEPRIVSRTGGVAFSATRSAEAFPHGERAPAVLRLPWPVDDTEDPVPDGFDTEVRLPLHADIDVPQLLRTFLADVDAVLLSLPWLRTIDIAGDRVDRVDISESEVELRGRRWLIDRTTGELPAEVVGTLGVEASAHPTWSVCLAVPMAGDTPQPVHDDVLHAPTPTDERLSVPAKVIATVPVEPSRRRVRRGPAVDAMLAAAATAYPGLLLKVAAEERTMLVPQPGFPKSEVDDQLRERVLAALRVAPWLPSASGRLIAPDAAVVLDVVSPPLAELVANVVQGLLAGELSEQRHAQPLAALGVRRLGLAELVAELTGLQREPAWWRKLYAALAPIADVDASAREALGALPVPLADGRTLPGARGALIGDVELSEVDVAGLRLVHPDAVHPLLERLGARHAGPRELLESDQVRDAVEQSVPDAESGVDTRQLAAAVLRLVSAANVSAGELPWLGALALPDTAGDWCRADELVLPGAPMLAVLAPDAPLGVLAPDVATSWPDAVLGAVGVLAAFAVLEVERPAGPDHDLADEQQWWDELTEPPATLLAVRDLDLVAEEAWPQALRLLAGEPATARALREPGYSTWWLSRFALLDGAPPRDWRLPDAMELAGLYDPVPDLGLDSALLAGIGVRAGLSVLDVADAEDLLARLADPEREPGAGVVLRATAELAHAVREGDVDPEQVRLPDGVRTLTDAVADPDGCVVLDGPWLLAVLAPGEVVAAGEDFELAGSLAELLDLPLAGEHVDAQVASDGDYVPWADLGAVLEAAELAGIVIPPGGPIVHDTLLVDADDARHDVPWWLTPDGILHVADTPQALAWAFAWVSGHWPSRHLLTALIIDPDPRTLLA